MGARVLGLILAGGLSTRMGGCDKALMPLAGKTMLARAVARLEPQVDAVAISANGDFSRFAEPGLTILTDTIPGHAGPLAGILAGLDWAAGEAAETRLLSVPVDTPFFPADLAERLGEAAGDAARVFVARSAGREHPTFALWHGALREQLRRFLVAGKSFRMRDFLASCEVVFVDFPPTAAGFDPFFNVNTPKDLALAERYCREGPA